jgi:hypothetical protein
MRCYNPPDSSHLPHDHNSLLGNETDDDEDDLDLKFDNLRTDYLEEYQSAFFVRLMF